MAVQDARRRGIPATDAQLRTGGRPHEAEPTVLALRSGHGSGLLPGPQACQVRLQVLRVHSEKPLMIPSPLLDVRSMVRTQLPALAAFNAAVASAALTATAPATDQ